MTYFGNMQFLFLEYKIKIQTGFYFDIKSDNIYHYEVT